MVGLAVLLAGSLPAQNILPNPGFETWLDTVGIQLPPGWLTSEITHPGSATKSPDSRDGSYCIQLHAPDTVAFASTTTLIRPGRSYDFTGHARTASALGGSFVISWLGLLGGPKGTPLLVPVYSSADYREYARRVTAPDSAFFSVIAFGTVPGATVYLDDVTLVTLAAGIRASNVPILNRFYLYPAQPNPAADFAVISYSLAVDDVASLRIYDLVGNEVRTLSDEYKPAGFYNAFWNAADNSGEVLAPGIYFCQLEVGNQTLTQKIILLGG